jgi:arylsulfatase
LESTKALPIGDAQLRYELNFVQPKEKLTNQVARNNQPAGSEAIFVNDVKVAQRDIVYAEARYIASYKDGIDVGQDLNSPVSDRYKVPFAFNGKLKQVVIDYK